jgi:phosphoribosylformylglycinamidine synthase subunit PurL
MTTRTLPAVPAPASISPELLKQHSLTAEEYARIEADLGRTPSLTELGIYSVMWSEHCSYKSSRVHLRRLPTRGERTSGPGSVVQGPGENAGIIDIGDGWACAFKIESHNHPSYIEPFQGATTGVGGILRDIFTMGARPLAVMDSLRFGPLSTEDGQSEDGESDPAVVRKNHQIVEGVVAGVASYGNCFGVPNLGGETRFEPCYSGNPLVNAFALGLVRKDEIFYAKATGIGNPVIYVGAKTGRDGIHGATMASEEFTEGSDQKRPNVQMGDPFMEKLLLEACLEAMQTGAVVGIQDMGAAGLTCSTCEMGARGGVGLDVELDNVPQRETGMSSYEIMLSESQERMLLVAEKGRENEVLRIFEKWGLDGVIVGEVIGEPRMRIRHHGELVADIPNQSLTDEAPLYHRPVGIWKAPVPVYPPSAIVEELKKSRDYTADLKKLLASANICSKRWVFEQYDSMVQTNTVQGPGGEAGVMRVKGSGTPGHERGLAMALDGNGRWCWLDPKQGAKLAVAEAARKVACTGAIPVAATNCLNFGNPEKPEIMAQLSAAIDGIAEACTALGTPITGGNVSLYNETKGEGIYPTPVIGVVGIHEDVSKAVPPDFQAVGHDVILIIPNRYQEAPYRELGASEFARCLLGEVWGAPPSIDLARERELHVVLRQLADRGLVQSMADVSDGGVALTLAEASFRNNIGVEAWFHQPKDASIVETLFMETPGLIVLTCEERHNAEVTRTIQQGRHFVCSPIGKTVSSRFEVRWERELIIQTTVDALKEEWSNALQSTLSVDTVTA